MKEGRSGATSATPKSIVFGAGTIHKGLKYEGAAWNFTDSLVGATSGGSKVSIKPEITKVEVDGVYVNTKELSIKTGGTATMEVSFIELTEDVLTAATLGKSAEATTDTRFNLIEDKATTGRTSPLSAKRWMDATSSRFWTMRCARPALKTTTRASKARSGRTRSSAMPVWTATARRCRGTSTIRTTPTLRKRRPSRRRRESAA